jgi:hypothetical protein
VVSPFTDNPEKRVVREQWDTPLLEHLHDTYGVRYRYLGLPGTDLIDVKLWRNMIDEVIAFEPLDRDGYGTRAITALRQNMRKAGIRGWAYCGSFEEVVHLRKDCDGQDYDQGGLVTLYNLDFCDEISSPVRTRERGQRVWRFQAIRQVLRDQVACFKETGGPRHFILMLTVRNQIGSEKIREFLSPSRLLGDAKTFYAACSAINAIPKKKERLIGSHSWALKTLLHNMLCGYFYAPHLSALFFPQVLYRGTETRDGIESPMLHWLVLCRFGDVEAPSPEFWPDEYLSRASVAVRDEKTLEWAAQTGEECSEEGPPNVVRWLTQHGGGILKGLRSS